VQKIPLKEARAPTYYFVARSIWPKTNQFGPVANTLADLKTKPPPIEPIAE
jgi:hypothetical protein